MIFGIYQKINQKILNGQDLALIHQINLHQVQINK